eukprot:TRINITY_DN105046_c0_g1_i1.p1 TRINITY_DN105046_c0_g1~~TRINITY_DN105046_c0_g1_i1.p1  ORF type:complete len:482 (-),score=64.02 TRINITY_DN105046_c0_g1_i1:132-1577(-)
MSLQDSRSKLQLDVEVISESIPTMWSANSGVFFNGRLFVSSSCNVLCIDPESGEHEVLDNSANMTIRNKTATGEPILRKVSAEGDISWWKLTLDGRQIVPLDNIARDETPNVIGFTSSGEEIRYIHSAKRVERLNMSRQVVWIAKVARTTGMLETMTIADDGFYFCTDTAVYFWPFADGHKEPTLVAGCQGTSGVKEGTGRRARFRMLRTPPTFSQTFNYIYVKDVAPDRILRIDTRTDEVRAISKQNLNLTAINSTHILPSNDTAIFVLDFSGLGDGRLFRCSVVEEEGPPALSTWHTLDLATMLQPISFHLSDGTVLHFDARILKARSEYFQKMFESGCREASECKVDLTTDSSVDRTSLEVVLRFIATGTFMGPSDSEMTMEQFFDVRSLADRYQLNELTEMVESRISKKLSISNVLICLQKVIGSGHKLESACWDLVEDNREEILGQSKDILTRLLKECPELGTELLTRNLKKRRVS